MPFVVQGSQPYLNIPLHYDNFLEGPTYGGELQAHWIINSRWRVNAGYGFLRLTLKPVPGRTANPASPNRDTPEHTFLAASSFQWTKRMETNLFLRAMSSASQANSPAYAQLGGRVGWHLSESSEFSVTAENLLNQSVPEFNKPEAEVPTIVGRSFFAKLIWHF